MTVERDPRATTAQQCSKGLILLEKQTAHLSKTLILHAHEIGTFCIDCTGTPSSVAWDVQSSSVHGSNRVDRGAGRRLLHCATRRERRALKWHGHGYPEGAPYSCARRAVGPQARSALSGASPAGRAEGFQ